MKIASCLREKCLIFMHFVNSKFEKCANTILKFFQPPIQEELNYAAFSVKNASEQ